MKLAYLVVPTLVRTAGPTWSARCAYRIFLACLVLASGHVFGQVKPIASGDILTYDNMKAVQQGSGPVTFVSETPSANSVIVEAGGDRIYKNVKSGGNYTLNKRLTRIANNGKTRPAEEVFHTLLSDKLEPGMNWKTTVKRRAGRCGIVVYDYDVSSSKGSDFVMQIDGKSTTLPTIQLEFRASPSGGLCGSWTQVKKMQISPELWEVVSEEFVQEQGGFLTEGYKFVITSIKSAAGQ